MPRTPGTAGGPSPADGQSEAEARVTPGHDDEGKESSHDLRHLDQERPHRRRLGRAERIAAMSAVKDGKIVEIGKLSGPATRTVDAGGHGRRARLYRQPLPLRRAGHLGPAVLVFVRPRRDQRDLRQLLAVARAGEEGPQAAAPAQRVPLLCRGDPDGGARHARVHLGDLSRISRRDGPQSRRQYRQPDRPHRGALLRDGRRVPEAHRDRRRDPPDAGPRPRRHEGRRARPVGVAQPGPFRPAGRPHPGDLGRREGDLRARRRAAASSAPASSSRAAATAPR